MQRLEIETCCLDHSLPFTHMCISKYCGCPGRLCQKCCTEHERQNQNNKLMKLENYVNKIEMEVDIIKKQTENITTSQKQHEKRIKQNVQNFQFFALNQVQILKDSLSYLNMEEKKVNKEIKEASQILLKKMENIKIKRKQVAQNFLRRICQKNMIKSFVMLYDQNGFQNFRSKLDKLVNLRLIIKDFLFFANKFGSEYEQFMKQSSTTEQSNLSMKKTIKQITISQNKLQKISGAESCKENVNRNQQPVDRQNLHFRQRKPSDTEQSPRKRRAKTIFGK